MKTFACAALAASAFLVAVSAAQAEDAQMRVKLSGIDMSSEAGAKTALARIQVSAADFCEASAGRTSLDRAAAEARCMDEMTRKGVRQLNAPMVSALLDGGAKPVQFARR